MTGFVENWDHAIALGADAGNDKLAGGSGKDTFVFKSVRESIDTKSGRDTVFDFDGKAGDRIDLRTIDDETKTKADGAFTFSKGCFLL